MIFNGVTDTCPLCGKEVYVGCKKFKGLTEKTFKIGRINCNILQIFLIIAVNISIISAIINISLGIKNNIWAVYPVVAIFSLYFVFAMLLGYTSTASGIRRIALLHFVGGTLLQFFCIKGWWMYGYYLPAFLIVANMFVCIVFFMPDTKRVSLFISEILLALMGATLLILSEVGIIPGEETTPILIIISFSIAACVFANYSIYMLFCLKDKFRTIMK